jgi:hypothetical protein
VFHVVFFVARGDVASTQGKATLCADEVETTEVVPFAKGLLLAIWSIYGEELCSDDITAILRDDLTLR